MVHLSRSLVRRPCQDPVTTPSATRRHLPPGRENACAPSTLAGLAALGMTLALVPAHARAPRHTGSATSASSTASLQPGGAGALPAAKTSPTPAADPLDQAPPPPDGYERVEDFDVTLQAHSADITAPTSSGMAPVDAQQMPRSRNSTARVFDVFGIPVKVDTPVVPPYNGSFTYDTYGGQPGKGRDAPGAWGAAGEP